MQGLACAHLLARKFKHSCNISSFHHIGSGKSSLLEALQFASGTPAAQLRVKTLKELCNSSAAEEVRVVAALLMAHAGRPYNYIQHDLITVAEIAAFANAVV